MGQPGRELDRGGDLRDTQAALALPRGGALAPRPLSGVGGPDELERRPPSSVDGRMHPLTLRFGPELDAEFAREYFARTLTQVRLGLTLAIGLYAVFGVLDSWIAPLHRRALWSIRYAVVCPLLAACLAFTFAPAFRRYKEAALGAVVLIMALGITAMTAVTPSPGSYLYYAGLVLVIVFTFTLVRLHFPHATALAAVVIATYVAVALWVIETPAVLLVNNLFFLVSSAIIGGIANYAMERYARSNFLQGRVIELRTRELERANRELVASNRQLAESRAATIRSAHRSELIFSALSEALPGSVLDDRYRVEEKIGSGAFGTVYRGEHLLLRHAVAIKVFRPSVGPSALESLDRFRLEGISACRIHHPNAVTVLDFQVSSESLAYLVMELLEGHSLADELRASGKLTAVHTARIAAPVCAVLAEAHAAGIVHRDVKPSNVFLHRSQGEQVVKVIDFGIAKLTADSPEPGLSDATMTGAQLGTPTYMAPERLGDGPYDGRSDVYAVGVMMYEMLTGRPPFVASNGQYWRLAVQHATEPPPPLDTYEPGVPGTLEAVVLRALAKEQGQRPTAAELASELRRFVRHESAAAT